jgi:predicted transcriptional regulator
MSNNATRKRRGRPPTTGTHPTFTVRLAEDLVTALARFAEAEELTRSEVIRAAVADYLKRKRAL